MFANFELSSAGLLEHPVRPRQVRSNQGCLHCRQIKKKCDEQKPMCGRCIHRRRTECIWQPVAPPRQCKSVIPSLERRRIETCTIVSPQANSDVVLVRTSAALARSLHGSLSSMLQLPDMHMPSLPGRCMTDLVLLGNQVVHGARFDDRYTLLSFNISHFADSPPLLHSWLSICAMHAAQQHDSLTPISSPWFRVALYFHGRAVHGLAAHLNSAPIVADWALCSIILLHVYEKLCDDGKPPCLAHVAAARKIFLERINRLPDSSYQVIQLESLVYRIAVMSIFHRPLQTHYESVSELAEVSKSAQFDGHDLLRHSLWASVPLAMYDIVYKLSFLFGRQPLNADWISKLDELEAVLVSHYKAIPLPVPEHHPNQSGLLAEQASCTLALYTYACLVIVAKLREPDATSLSAKVQTASAPGFCMLQHLTEINFMSPVVLWPACILGLTAESSVYRLNVTNYIKHSAQNTGIKATRSVLCLLDKAWHSAEFSNGLDILFDDQALSSVIM